MRYHQPNRFVIIDLLSIMHIMGLFVKGFLGRLGSRKTSRHLGGNSQERKVPDLQELGVDIPPAGIEPATFGLGNHCSIQLSYEGILF